MIVRNNPEDANRGGNPREIAQLWLVKSYHVAVSLRLKSDLFVASVQISLIHPIDGSTHPIDGGSAMDCIVPRWIAPSPVSKIAHQSLVC
ncbi:hypothetical protein Pla22_12170 [Rubripirellula amarantea]|uniref:Uncharacterized protein n=1 Tax=Rubripirellula amarantea TaxID=2527999 RepID=A0A5C5WSV9_9BACT|nr:hypothetical protein Pla22_12170 [Rubripirellula amarantea]